MEKKFKALRIIGTLYKVLGAIVGVLTILTALGLCATSTFGGAAVDNLSREFGAYPGFLSFFGGVLGGLVLGLLSILYGGGIAVTLFAFGEGVYLLLALEENTRESVSLLREKTEE